MEWECGKVLISIFLPSLRLSDSKFKSNYLSWKNGDSYILKVDSYIPSLLQFWSLLVQRTVWLVRDSNILGLGKMCRSAVLR
jgi:hypothetical protein